MRLPEKVLYTRKEFRAPGETVHIPLKWEPGISQGNLQLWVMYPGPGKKWERLTNSVQCESYSGVLPLKILAVIQHGEFPCWETDCSLSLPTTTSSWNIAIDNSTRAEGDGVGIGGRTNLTINGLGENPLKEEACPLSWRPALTPFFRISSAFPAGGKLEGSTALLRRGSETALIDCIDCRSWRQVERGFFLLEPPGGSAADRWRSPGPIPMGPQPHQWLAVAVARELAVGRLHVHDDPEGAHWPLGWRIEEVAPPGMTMARLNREMDCRLDGRDPAVKARADAICDLGRLDMSRWHSTLAWDRERGLQGATRKSGTDCSVTPLGDNPLSGPWELSLVWMDGRFHATLQIHRESIPGDYSLDWFWATQSKPDGAPRLEDRIFVWFPWEWRYELSKEQLEGVDRSAFWGRIGTTPFLWALQEDGSVAFYDEDELPKEILHGESHG